MRVFFSLCALANMAACIPPSVYAQEAATQDIIVTARGRSEALQKVPDTLSVYNAQTLKARRLTNLDELLLATPGVFLINDQDSGTNLISVRGVSTNRNQAPSIAFVVDGIPLADSEFFTLRPFDLNRVEILKGPQGALFGRSASGGVIAFLTNEPGEDFAGQVQAGYGNGDTYQADGAVDLPVNQALQLRLAGSFRTTNGFIHNSFLDKKVDGFASRNVRLKASFRLSEQVLAKVRLAFVDEEGGAAFISSGNITGRFGGRLAGEALTEPFGDFEGRASRRYYSLNAGLEVDLGELGLLSLQGGYDDYHKDFVEELDFRNDKPITFFGLPVFPQGIQPIAQPVDINAFTLQARLTSPDTVRVRYSLGLFYQNIDRVRTDDFGPLLFGAEAPRIATKAKQYGVFGQIGFDVLTDVEATLALRYDAEERQERTRGVMSGRLLQERRRTFEKVQPKASLAWQIQDNLAGYATLAVGFKAGGFNPIPGPQDSFLAVFPSERTRSAELGFKAQAFDKRLNVAVALFATDYANFQNTVFVNGNSTVFSVPDVNVRGGEASFAATLSKAVQLDGSLAYARSRTGRYFTPNPTPEPGEPLLLDLSGKRTPNAPEFTLRAGAQWQGALGPALLTARLDATRISSVVFEIDNILFTPAYTLVDGRLAVSLNTFEFELWAKNIFDKRYAISAFGQQQLALLLGLGPNGPFDSFTLNSGRQFGASLTKRF